MSGGYLITLGLITIYVAMAIQPLRRSGRLGILSWLLSMVVAEAPVLTFYWLLAVTVQSALEGDFDTFGAAAAVVACCAGLACTIVLSRRGLRAGATIDRALDDGLGRGWRTAAGDYVGPSGHGRLPWLRILLVAPIRPRNVRRIANLAYGPHGRRNRLDLYWRRTPSPGAPILINLHGGGFRVGRKNVTSRPLLHRFTQRGWVCISANYRLKPQVTYSDILTDVKQIIAWARAHAHEFGADPSRIVVSGSSAGAHLAVMAALTANDPRYQPGFTDVDTSVAAAVGLYGYYGPAGHGPVPSCPLDYLHAGAPPILLAHGSQDTLVSPAQPRELAARLRATSVSPVVYAELPGAQHSFDLFWSLRFATLIDGIDTFTAAVGVSNGGRYQSARRVNQTGVTSARQTRPPSRYRVPT